jgi:hypothetical protein
LFSSLQIIGKSADISEVMTADDKRDRERVPLAGQVTGEVMVYQPVTIRDISHGGAQIETPFPMQLDSLHDFRLALGPRSIVVKGRIAHCHVDQLTESSAVYRTGVEFIEPSEHVREAIAAFVAALKAANAAIEGDLPRYPAIDAARFKAQLDAFLAEARP